MTIHLSLSAHRYADATSINSCQIHRNNFFCIPKIQYDGPLQFSVLEEVAAGWEVDTLRASDPDQGENAAIEYLIICKLHHISKQLGCCII